MSVKEEQWTSSISNIKYKITIEKIDGEYCGKLYYPDGELFGKVCHPLPSIVQAGIDKMQLQIQIFELLTRLERLEKGLK